MHVLPRVRELEERFSGDLVVVGVHAGKFAAERVTRNLAAACERLDVRHPVVNDRQFRIWKSYAIQAWPTVAIVDAAGMLVGIQAGEFPVDDMARVIASIIERDRDAQLLAPGADPTVLPAREDGPLRFPTRVIAEGDRRWVSDAGHGRVCEFVTERSDVWRLERVWDGFVEPQGLARQGGATYVADRRGQTIYRLDEDAATVVAGTGRLGEYRLKPGLAGQMDLRSPWGLAPLPSGDLAVAMAGAHQLWRLEGAGRKRAELVRLAGAGAEELLDGNLDHSLLAQPTGLSLAGDRLAFADSESSAVRVVDLGEELVTTVVGTGLFDFGDRDGEGDDVLLQHAQDLAWRDGEIVVADTYNDRLKVVDPETRGCVAHRGEAGEAGSLWEPMGVSVHGEELLVADTNNHRIVSVSRDGLFVPIEVEA